MLPSHSTDKFSGSPLNGPYPQLVRGTFAKAGAVAGSIPAGSILLNGDFEMAGVGNSFTSYVVVDGRTHRVLGGPWDYLGNAKKEANSLSVPAYVCRSKGTKVLFRNKELKSLADVREA